MIHIVERTFWIARIRTLLARRPIVWIHGVRRVGKTWLCRSLPDVLYLDCTLPAVRRELQDPAFLPSVRGRLLAIDEIHNLDHPAELLKILADHHPDIRAVVTGSSTLEMSRGFRDTLTGRKYNLHLVPTVSQDLRDFGIGDISQRLFRGGLPPFLLSAPLPEDYEEWTDSYLDKDIRDLFAIAKRREFRRLLEFLLASSGGILNLDNAARSCGISRITAERYLSILEASGIVHLIKPFSSRSSREIVSAPKVYGFDTGFVRHFRGWETLRPEDRGALWEHLVLNELLAVAPHRRLRYWRDKNHHEIDFILADDPRRPVALECKTSLDAFEPSSLRSFRRRYPEGENLLVTLDEAPAAPLTFGDLQVLRLRLEDLSTHLASSPPPAPRNIDP